MDLVARSSGVELRAFRDPYVGDVWARSTGSELRAFRVGTIAATVAAPPTGAISGTASITFGQSATLVGAGALVGSTTITWAQAGMLTGAGALAGSSAVTFGQAGTLVGSAALAGSASITWAQTGVLVGLALVSGASSITFGASGNLTAYTTPNPHLEYTKHVLDIWNSAQREYDMRFSISYNAELFTVYTDGIPDIQIGTVLYRNTEDTGYVSPLNPLRTGRPVALATMIADTVCSAVASGNVSATYTQLGTGSASMVAVDFTTGLLRRVASPSAGDELVGWCDTLGNAHLLFGGVGQTPFYRGSAAPTTGTWVTGDIVWNSSPTAGGAAGWICVAGGTPGTWKTFATIAV